MGEGVSPPLPGRLSVVSTIKLASERVEEPPYAVAALGAARFWARLADESRLRGSVREVIANDTPCNLCLVLRRCRRKMTVTCRTATLFLRPKIFSPTGERAYPLTARLLIEREAFEITATVLFAPNIGQLLSATSTW